MTWWSYKMELQCRIRLAVPILFLLIWYSTFLLGRLSRISDQNDIYKSHRYFLNGLFYSGEVKNRFSIWQLWRPSCISIGTILTVLDLKSSWYFISSFESTGLSVQENKRKIDFQDGGHGSHLGFPIGKILSIFDLLVTPMLPTKFYVSCPFGSGDVKNRFSRWWPYIAAIADFHS